MSERVVYTFIVLYAKIWNRNSGERVIVDLCGIIHKTAERDRQHSASQQSFEYLFLSRLCFAIISSSSVVRFELLFALIV